MNDTQALDISDRVRHGEYLTTGEGVVTPGRDPFASGKSISLTHGTGASFVEIVDTIDSFVDMSVSVWFAAQDDPGLLTFVAKNFGGDTQGEPFALAYSDDNLFVFAGGENEIALAGVATGEPHHKG